MKTTAQPSTSKNGHKIREITNTMERRGKVLRDKKNRLKKANASYRKLLSETPESVALTIDSSSDSSSSNNDVEMAIDSSSDSSSSNNDVEMVFDRPIIIPRGRARFTDQVVTLSETGELKIDGELKGQWDAETMALIKSFNLNTSKILVRQNGYLYIGGTGTDIHVLLGRSKLQKDFEKFKAEGFTGTIQDLDAVAHLDDDKWNCNIGNLMNMPEAWNYNLKKVKGANKKRKKWICQLVIAESKTFNTKTVSDPDEALVQYGMILLLDIFNILIDILDILKVKHCVEHVKQSPLIAQLMVLFYVTNV